ncbi:MAG: hypothetical protein U0075_07780 [Thermomicrobiales bacterium]
MTTLGTMFTLQGLVYVWTKPGAPVVDEQFGLHELLAIGLPVRAIARDSRPWSSSPSPG